MSRTGRACRSRRCCARAWGRGATASGRTVHSARHRPRKRAIQFTGLRALAGCPAYAGHDKSGVARVDRGGAAQQGGVGRNGLGSHRPLRTSSPAKAGDPVFTGLRVLAGCPAYAGHDNRAGSSHFVNGVRPPVCLFRIDALFHRRRPRLERPSKSPDKTGLFSLNSPLTTVGPSLLTIRGTLKRMRLFQPGGWFRSGIADAACSGKRQPVQPVWHSWR